MSTQLNVILPVLNLQLPIIYEMRDNETPLQVQDS